jgi:FkbM family methyltransferase
MSFKRKVANLLEKVSGNLVVPPHELHLAYERQHLKKLFEYCAVDCVFDVGANRGQYAKMLRENVGFRGDIISFEPIPQLAADMRKAAASDDRWYVEEVALDSEAGAICFNVMASDQFSSLHRPEASQPVQFSASNRIVESISVMRSTVAIQLEKYRSKLKFLRPFLKMDTQGNDLEVVKGAADTLAIFVGLQSELAIERLYAGTMDFADTIAAYVDRGFSLSALVPNNAGHFPRLVEIDCIMIRSDLLE